MEELVQEFEAARQELGFSVPVTLEQGIQCAFIAGHRVGYRKGFKDCELKTVEMLSREMNRG